jgi:diguanylate cyclase (GGDEF)-like protein
MVSITIIPIKVEEKIMGVIGVSRDITEQINLEILLFSQQRLLEMVIQNRPLQRILDEITALFDIIFPYNGRTIIMLVNENTDRMSIVSAPSLSNKEIHFLNSVLNRYQMESFLKSPYVKNVFITDDIQTSPNWAGFQEEVLQHNFHAIWSAPLKDDYNKVYGVFAILFNHRRKPALEDIPLLKVGAYTTSHMINYYRTREKIRHLAYHDTLTGLPNQRFLDEKLKKVEEMSRHVGANFSALMIDLDRFKNINDSYGHDVGDEFLIRVSKRLKNCLEDETTISRLGGDEFAILLENADECKAEELAMQIIKALEEPLYINGKEIFVTASIGISVYPKHGTSAHELFVKADAAMYQAKSSGGNNYKFHNDQTEKQNMERFQIENQL